MRNSHLIILIVVLLIACLGVISIYSSTYQKEGKLWQEIYKRQILWVLFGLTLFLLISNINYRNYWDVTYILYAFMIFILLLVFALGTVRLGAQRWIRIVWFNFQPAEFAKLIAVIFLSRYFSRKSFSDISLLSSRLGIVRGLILPFTFIAIPVGLIIEQPDLGSGMMIILFFIAMLFFSGVKLRYIFIL